MSGSYEQGKKAENTNKKLYGADFYKTIGRAGGLKSRGGGFAKNPELASKAGRIGGMMNRRVNGKRITKEEAREIIAEQDGRDE